MPSRIERAFFFELSAVPTSDWRPVRDSRRHPRPRFQKVRSPEPLRPPTEHRRRHHDTKAKTPAPHPFFPIRPAGPPPQLRSRAFPANPLPHTPAAASPAHGSPHGYCLPPRRWAQWHSPAYSPIHAFPHRYSHDSDSPATRAVHPTQPSPSETQSSPRGPAAT
jgi:hypothetical protein